MNLLWFVLNVKEVEPLIKLMGNLSPGLINRLGISEKEHEEIFNIYSKWSKQKEQFYKILEESDNTDKQLLDWFIERGWWEK